MHNIYSNLNYLCPNSVATMACKEIEKNNSGKLVSKQSNEMQENSVQRLKVLKLNKIGSHFASLKVRKITAYFQRLA